MLSLSHQGDFGRLESRLNRYKRLEFLKGLEKYGQRGCAALASATPTDTGKTSNSWTYEIKSGGGKYSIIWKNTNVVNGVPIAIILQCGHGTGTGGWVQGVDYINPALAPIFAEIKEEVRRKVAAL